MNVVMAVIRDTHALNAQHCMEESTAGDKGGGMGAVGLEQCCIM